MRGSGAASRWDIFCSAPLGFVAYRRQRDLTQGLVGWFVVLLLFDRSRPIDASTHARQPHRPSTQPHTANRHRPRACLLACTGLSVGVVDQAEVVTRRRRRNKNKGRMLLRAAIPTTRRAAPTLAAKSRRCGACCCCCCCRWVGLLTGSGRARLTLLRLPCLALLLHQRLTVKAPTHRHSPARPLILQSKRPTSASAAPAAPTAGAAPPSPPPRRVARSQDRDSSVVGALAAADWSMAPSRIYVRPAAPSGGSENVGSGGGGGGGLLNALLAGTALVGGAAALDWAVGSYGWVHGAGRGEGLQQSKLTV